MTAGYLLRRLASIILVLLIVSFSVFAVTQTLPGNAAVMMLGEYASQDQINALESRLGLELPWYAQYGRWLGHILQGDWGQSIGLSTDISQLIGNAFWHSAELAGAALLVVVIVALPLGVLSAMRRGRLTDLLIGLFSYLGTAVPEFVTATLLLIVFAGAGGFFPSGGFTPPGENFGAFLHHLILPTAALCIILTAHVSRQVRSEMSDVLASDYVRAARLRGVSERSVVWHQALRNAMAPAIAVVSLDVGYLLGGILVVEEIFAWPGLGRLMMYALQNRDLPLIQATTLVLAAVYAISNLLADIAIALIDPRVRYA